MSNTPPPAGFTPGTYNVSKGVHDWFVLNDDGYTVAVCGSEEDAHLVCAAPDLYAALAELLDGIDRWDEAVSKIVDTSKMPKWAGKDRARAALRKAGGAS